MMTMMISDEKRERERATNNGRFTQGQTERLVHAKRGSLSLGASRIALFDSRFANHELRVSHFATKSRLSL